MAQKISKKFELKEGVESKKFLKTFNFSIHEKSAASGKAAAKMLADALLKNIPFDAKNDADVKAKRKLVGALASVFLKKKDRFFEKELPALVEAKESMKGSKLSTPEAVSKYISAIKE